MLSTNHSNLIRLVEDYLTATGVPHAAFGRAACGDAWLVSDLRDGGEISPYTTERVIDFVLDDMADRLRPDRASDQLNPGLRQVSVLR